MPIKTSITVGADEAKFKNSYAAFEKYRAALKETHGLYVLQAPHIRAASAVGDDLAKFVNGIDRATNSQGKFITGAEKAAKAFHGVGVGVKSTLESFARLALSPLQMLFPAGLAIGLFGLGGALIGAGTFFGLERGAAGVSDRRREAMGLGVSYGSLSAYELNFSRFGVGEGTLGAVASGVYDVTSPEYLGLLSSGATGHGDTSEAAIDLIRNIPKILQGVPDEMVGPVARSHNLTDLLDLPTIVRLKNHPEEIEAQIARYRRDRNTLDISKEAQQKWAAFDAALSRAGQKIESALGKNLVSLAPGLKQFSDDAVKLISAFIDSGAVTDALKGIQGGLQWFERCVGSSSFRRDSAAFLEGLDKLGTVAGPALLTLMQIEGALGLVGLGGLSRALKRVTINGATFWVIGKFAEGALSGKLFEPTTGANRRLAQDLGIEPRGDSSYAPVRTSNGAYLHDAGSIRYYAGRGARRSKFQPAIDSITGKPEIPEFKYSPRHGEGGGRGWNASVGDIPPALLARVQASNPQLTPRQCVELIQSTMGVGNVHDWRRGPSEKDSPEGAALATFGFHGDSSLYAYGGSGTPGIGRDHALKLVKKYPDGSFDAISQDIGHAPHLIHMPYTGTGGEGDASSYFAVFDKNGRPAGGNAELFDKLYTGTTAIGHPHSTGRMPVGAPMDLPGATPPSAIGDTLHYDNDVGLRNMALRQRGRALHILDHMDIRPPPGPIIVHNQTGGSAQVTISRHEATQ